MAVTRNANAEWRGDLKSGSGNMRLGSGAYEGQYSFQSRFEQGTGTNPEELIAAAHAGCFSMALSATLGSKGFKPSSVKTEAKVSLEKVGEGFAITTIHLTCEAQVPGIDGNQFQEIANEAKETCPVSKALAGTKISLEAKLT